MRRTIGRILVIVPTAFIALGLLVSVFGAVTGTSAEGEFTTSLIITGMVAVVALVPITIGALMLLDWGREPSGTGATQRAAAPHHSGRPRERLGWAFVVPGVIAVMAAFVLFANEAGGMAVVTVLAASVVLIGVGSWLVHTARLQPDAPPPLVPGPPPPSPDRELQDH